MNICERLERLKIAIPANWGELGEHLGIKRSMLHYLRTGDREPSAKLLRRIEQLEVDAGIKMFTHSEMSVLSKNVAGPLKNPPDVCRYPEACDIPRELAQIREQQANTYREVGELKSLLESLLEGDTLERIIKEQRQARRNQDAG